MSQLYRFFLPIYWLLVFSSLGLASALQPTALWRPLEVTAAVGTIKRVSIDRHQSNKFYAASQNTLYLVDSAARNFRLLKVLPSSEDEIQSISNYSDCIEVVTSKQLFALETETQRITTQYRSTSTEHETLLDSIRTDRQQFLATTRGVYYRGTNVADPEAWQAISGIPDTPIYDLTKDSQFVYAMSSNSLYRIPIARPDNITIILKTSAETHLDNDDVNSGVGGADEKDLLAISNYSLPAKPSHTLVVSTKGLLLSTDNGMTWQPVGSSANLLKSVTALVLPQTDLAATARDEGYPLPYYPTVLSDIGIFQWQGSAWQPLYRGLPTKRINDLTLANDTLYAATDQGLFLWVKNASLPHQEPAVVLKPEPLSYDAIEQRFVSEPSIQTVHQWAIRYAEVNKEKIDEWRKQARKRAWLPGLNIGLDVDRDWSRSDSLWGSGTNGRHHQGPDDDSYGKGVSWGISMSWDLADLVWSSDQPSIDSRSKLMVELREDIIGQVTRIYFERRRLQIELLMEELTKESTLNSQMRIAELTALIDGFTGGRFSDAITRLR